MLVRYSKYIISTYSQFIRFFFIEINQKVQNSTVGASKVHSNNDLNGIERANSTGARESMIEIKDYQC